MLWHDRDDYRDDYDGDRAVDDDEDDDVGSWTSKSKSSSSLSRQERLLAAEMAEQCLRELIEEEDARRDAIIDRVNVVDDNNGKIDDHEDHYDEDENDDDRRGGYGRRTPKSNSTTTSPYLYYLVIRAWLNVDGGADRRDGRYLRHASSLLDLMERRSTKTMATSSSSVSTICDRDVHGLARCYAIVLDGHCKSKLDGSEIRAEGVLRRMMGSVAMMTDLSGGGTSSSSSGGIGGGSSIVRHYNDVINRIATGGKSNAGREAERLLDELIGLSSSSHRVGRGWSDAVAPNRTSYNAVMKAYANARGGKREDAISNIERILGIMEGQSPSSGISPDKISYTTLLTAYSSGGNGVGAESCPVDAGERAEGLLERMTREYVETGNADVKPDTVTYNAVLKVWYVLTVIIIGHTSHPSCARLIHPPFH